MNFFVAPNGFAAYRIPFGTVPPPLFVPNEAAKDQPWYDLVFYATVPL